MKNHFERSRELASPTRDWDEFINYEAVWDALFCQPEPQSMELTTLELRRLRLTLLHAKAHLRNGRRWLIDTAKDLRSV